MQKTIKHIKSNFDHIKVAIIEDNKEVRESVVKYLQFHDDIGIDYSFDSAEAYLEYIGSNPLELDILLLDIGLPGMSGLDAIQHILNLNKDLNIIMLTANMDEDQILKAIENGAVAYVAKSNSLSKIIDAIRIVKNGGSYMSPSIAREIFQHIHRKNNKKDLELLSSRQKEILELLSEGFSYSEIASNLFLSIETIRSHIKKMYKILHVSNKNEAVAKYLNENN